MKKIALLLIRFYQKTISPDHGIFSGSRRIGFCKFKPTCSEYTYQAIEKYGILQGSFIGFWRVNRCNPFSKGGYEEIPKDKNKNLFVLRGLATFFIYLAAVYLTIILIKVFITK